MATLNRDEIVKALTRLGEIASAQGLAVRLVLLGGGAMVLAFNARESTRDLDVAILPPTDAAAVRSMAEQIAGELGWPQSWLNDAAKAYLIGLSAGPVVFASPGIEVIRPGTEQLLAMKLCAWRDDLDVADARRLMEELTGARDEVWGLIEPYLQPGHELKARYAFDDLWEATRGAP